jgi:hypothetical protein
MTSAPDPTSKRTRPGSQMLLIFGLTAFALTLSGFAWLQDVNPLLKRWVGTHKNQTLFLDFYSDTVVVDVSRGADFIATNDSIVVFGDTSFAVHYRFAQGWLLIRTEEGDVITMSSQGPLARPLWGRWLGRVSRMGNRMMELQIRGNGTAYWRWIPGGERTEGEWDRFSRILTFTWLPDTVVWNGLYDPMQNQLLFEGTVEGSGVVVLERFFRRPSY